MSTPFDGSLDPLLPLFLSPFSLTPPPLRRSSRYKRQNCFGANYSNSIRSEILLGPLRLAKARGVHTCNSGFYFSVNLYITTLTLPLTKPDRTPNENVRLADGHRQTDRLRVRIQDPEPSVLRSQESRIYIFFPQVGGSSSGKLHSKPRPSFSGNRPLGCIRKTGKNGIKNVQDIFQTNISRPTTEDRDFRS